MLPHTIMASTSPFKNDETLRFSAVGDEPVPGSGWIRSAPFALAVPSRLIPVACSFADQALAVGSTFLANVMLARTESKQQYGVFALSYSVFTFLSGLHNSAVLEPCTVYGSGRYQSRFSSYLRLMMRVNALVGLLLMSLVLLVYVALYWMAPQYLSGALLGLGVTVGTLLSGAFLRRAFYLQRQPEFAVRASLICFVTVACGLWVAARTQMLNGFSVFVILALGWVAAGLGLRQKLMLGDSEQPFLDLAPRYWWEHWNYSKWVFLTALVFQLTSQGYYWLAAGFVSFEQVAELRVMSMLIAPVDQAFIALSYLVVPALASRYASGRREEFLSLSMRYGLLILGTTGVFAFAVRLLGRALLHGLYAGKFDGVAPLLSLLAFSPVLMGVGNAASCALSAVEKPRLVFLAYVCSGVATIAGGIPLVIHFGLAGAVYGMLLSAATYSAALVSGFYQAIYRNTEK